ncbi:PTS sugar transporter subunit IIA [Corynebacterium sputi]|uniref:PTS sugar transporter subunit IIA n=1 Tax=Corynebacterium sputi TaxID=489915 RepID=UPI0003F72DE7|nr:PTS sugar transporter subunit IIA [Corynebacterium sputi]
MSTIRSLLEESSIRLDAPAENWQEAITVAGEILEKSGATDAPYTQSMIDNVLENGPYIVVAPGFAFAHARPDESVHRTAMSWVRLAEPVEFGHKRNDPVTLVLALAATDAKAHTQAMGELAKVLANPQKRQQLDTAATPAEVLDIFGAVEAQQTKEEAEVAEAKKAQSTEDVGSGSGVGGGEKRTSGSTRSSKNHILTVCGNGLGTSLFLKNTLEQVLKDWGWGSYLSVEATDTISAKGKAKDADFILTSGEIARALGDLGVPVYVIENFSDPLELDTALRELYDV